MDSAYVLAELPRTGLGNMLFVWAKAFVYAHSNNLDCFTSSWTKFKFGPILRRERSLRLYTGFFRQTSRLGAAKRFWVRWTYQQVCEPRLDASVSTARGHLLYVFRERPDPNDYFGEIREFREMLREGLYDMLSERCRVLVESAARPVIGVHVRQGDFRTLPEDEDFASVGQARTPMQYFVEIVQDIREVRGSELPVVVFSDGTDGELGPLLQMGKVRRAPQHPDVVDLLMLSRSQLIVASASSTFSLWSGFLSDSPMLMHPDHIQRLRPKRMNELVFEGGVRGRPSSWPELLIKNIQEL